MDDLEGDPKGEVSGEQEIQLRDLDGCDLDNTHMMEREGVKKVGKTEKRQYK